MLPGNCHLKVYDEVVKVTDKEAFVMTRRLIVEEGLCVGPSSALILVAAMKYAEKVTKPSKIVVIMPDSGKAYLSKAFNDQWLADNELISRDELKAAFNVEVKAAEEMKKYISTVMKGTSIDVIPPLVSSDFEVSKLPVKPIIAIHSREQRDAINFIKSFYVKFPQYRWITFRDLRGLSENEFADAMKESFVSIWIDQTSSYGTFPLESMKMGIPVLGLVPDIVPTWMNEDNGLWVNNKTIMVDVLSDLIQNWLEDNLNPELFENMDRTVQSLPNQEKFEQETLSLFSKMFETRLTSFEDQLSKFETI
jgi:hypothetical protein